MPDTPPHTGEVTIPVRYDGEDLDEVARLLGVSAEEVVNRHLAAGWQVAFSGFAPGFGYAVGADPLFDVPRRSSPRGRSRWRGTSPASTRGRAPGAGS